MRADAERNLDAVLQTGARLLAVDPATSIAAIAAEAGVDRRTVYRRFASREALLCAVFHTRLDAVDEVCAEARLEEAPVAVALHRFVEGIVSVNRRWPLDTERMQCDSEGYDRMLIQRERVSRFVERAIADGLIRSDLPDGMAQALLIQIVHLTASQFPQIEAAPAADIIIETAIRGIGRARLIPEARSGTAESR
jgi:AcrR family transcriptional regulator